MPMPFSERSGLGDVGAAVPDPDADDDELGGVDRLDADLDVEPSELAGGRRVQDLVDAHEERVLRGRAEQGPVAPGAGEELSDRALQRLPQREVVGLEDAAPDADLDRLLEVQE